MYASVTTWSCFQYDMVNCELICSKPVASVVTGHRLCWVSMLCLNVCYALARTTNHGITSDKPYHTHTIHIQST